MKLRGKILNQTLSLRLRDEQFIKRISIKRRKSFQHEDVIGIDSIHLSANYLVSEPHLPNNFRTPPSEATLASDATSWITSCAFEKGTIVAPTCNKFRSEEFHGSASS